MGGDVTAPCAANTSLMAHLDLSRPSAYAFYV